MHIIYPICNNNQIHDIYTISGIGVAMNLREKSVEEKKLTSEQLFNIKMKNIDLQIAKQQNAMDGEQKATVTILSTVTLSILALLIVLSITAHRNTIHREEIEKELVLRGYFPVEESCTSIPKWQKQNSIGE